MTLLSGKTPPPAAPAAGPSTLATLRAAVTAAIKDAGYLHIPEGRRDHTTPAEALRLHGLDEQMRTFTEHAGALAVTRGIKVLALTRFRE